VAEAAFFLQKTVENGWSRGVLLNFLDTDLFQSQGKAITNFVATLPSPQSDLAIET
jgi:predicted nuclease of restriction endonuclease-like (RecB) superfamily